MTLPTDRRQLLFLLAGGRPGGNTEALARHAAAHLPEDASTTWLHLDDSPLPAFRDDRHTDGAARTPTGGELALLEATLACTDLVIASPVYWGGLAAPAKLYLDHVVGWVRLPGVDLRARMRERTLWGVGVLNGPGLADAQPMVDMLESAADYLDMRFGGVLLGNGDRPGEVLADAPALERAERFFAGASAEPV
ncbi:NAD(P)H-dependent oxidoreductase [Kitasatospora sp. NBC_01287]|uniref:NAD(P)H-dependent oxidoreductase n=1 Tax=Kitasatospora sp. NBC_01287 TaxID=2903573 RepID=UPI00224E2D80|nr:NAD(P)H-dependent oxidoreductase [Kitasatospora sp. NBC_01287]MCX4747239.1 NAD(P)H-dependent oxidoreductase [Kitasatospora sp. NBC_01287]